MSAKTCLKCGYSAETIADARGFCLRCRNVPGPRSLASPASADALPALQATALSATIACWVTVFLIVIGLALAGEGHQGGDMFGAGYYATGACLLFGGMVASGVLWGRPAAGVANGLFAGGAAAILCWAPVVLFALTR